MSPPSFEIFLKVLIQLEEHLMFMLVLICFLESAIFMSGVLKWHILRNPTSFSICVIFWVFWSAKSGKRGACLCGLKTISYWNRQISVGIILNFSFLFHCSVRFQLKLLENTPYNINPLMPGVHWKGIHI